MPFKSEKQRRYLWANEPEIARDWTDTYGSKIKKAEGGISQLVRSGGDGKRPGYKGGADAATESFAKSYDKAVGNTPGTTKGRPDRDLNVGGSGEGPTFRDEKTGTFAPPSILNKEQIKNAKDFRALQRFKSNLKKKHFTPGITTNLLSGLLKGNLDYRKEFLKNNPQLLEYFNTLSEEDQQSRNTMMSLADIMNVDGRTYEDFLAYDKGSPHLKFSGDVGKWERYKKPDGTYDYKLKGEGGGGQQPLWMQQGYPSLAAWQAAQQGGAVTTTPTTTTQTTSPFQQSLNTGNTGVTSSLSPYYVGAAPTAANLAWGQQFNVDPRTMYRTQWADGGPIRQRYFLGKLVKKIGRAAKKVIKSPLGKIGIGALAMGMPWARGGTWFGDKSAWGKMAPWILGKKDYKGVGDDYDGRTGGLLDLLFKSGKEGERTWNPWKIGIGAATVAPFLMGSGDTQEQDKAFDYDKNKLAWANDLMKIRQGSMAGTLNPLQWSFLPSDYVYNAANGGRIGHQHGGSEDPLLVEEYKKYVFEMEEMGLQPISFEQFKREAIAGMASGGRAGYYAGGQSIPSENTMEDARKTAMQDRLGGITEVMKQADLYRQGDIGQMYMANGGSTQEEGIMDLGGMEKDYRETGGFVPIGKEEKADDVPARLSLNEFVMTADAVRGMGDGDIDQGAERMEDLMETLEVKGKKNQGAQDMFEVSERLSAVV